MEIRIRNFREEDRNAIIKICLQTGYSGKDATEFFHHKDLLAYYYALPYLEYSPELCFVATKEGQTVGYILGVKNSLTFSSWIEKYWFPTVREKFPLQINCKTPFEKRIVELIHSGYRPKKEMLNFPAHLHIDILPIAQGKGVGKRLIEKFSESLKNFRVYAVHLEVGKRNLNAIEFYKKVGFKIIKEFEYSIAFGKKLN